MSYLAERGRIITNDEGAYLVMFEGYVHRYDGEDKDKAVQIVAFDQNMLDLSEFNPEDDAVKDLRPRERYLGDLISPRPDDMVAQRHAGRLRAELHDRLSTPLYPLVFAFIAVALLAHARTTRESRWGRDSGSRGHRRGLAGCRPDSQQPGPRVVGRTPCVCYSNWGDSRCGVGGAR